MLWVRCQPSTRAWRCAREPTWMHVQVARLVTHSLWDREELEDADVRDAVHAELENL